MKDNLRQALKDVLVGKPVILTDDEDRENEGDLVIAADRISFETLLFGIKCLGYICVASPTPRLDELGLPIMVSDSTCKLKTPFAITCDSLGEGMTSGVSCRDRLQTIHALANDDTKAEDLAKPGHINILRAKPGLLSERRGHTEGSCQLLKLAGIKPMAVIVEIMDPETGEMMRGQKMLEFAAKHNLTSISIQEIYDEVYNSGV